MATVQEHVERIRERGYDVVAGVIPEDVVGDVREEIVAVQAAHNAESEARQAATRAKGHRIGAKGVGVRKQVINDTQIFAPYLADDTLVGIAEAFFGEYVRISCTDAVVNHPGNERGYWHADWPYNQTNASHIRAPYPDVMVHMSTIWMLTDFSAENGGTFLRPGSHRQSVNPSMSEIDGFDPDGPADDEERAEGKAGSVLIYDSRLWHAVAPNESDGDRVALIVRYAPWWLNLNPSMVGAPEHTQMVVETGGKNYESVPIDQNAFDRLPENVQSLYRHFVAQPD